MHPHPWQLVSLAMLTLACITTQVLAPPTTIDTPAGKMIVIDGSKNPLDIPEHALWRHCFYKLAHAKRLNATDYIDSIGLSRADLAEVLKTAEQQAARDDACARRMEEEPHALEEITLDCRYRDLEARDRLLERVSPEGREQLRVWAEGIRRGMTVYWPANDIEQFKRPY